MLLAGGSAAQGSPVGAWTYALAAPFRTVDDGVTLADLQAAWRGRPGGALATHPLLVSAGTQHVLAALWGEPAARAVRTVDEQRLLAEAERTSAWAIVPFDALEMRWKVLLVDGLSPLARGLGQSYPLQVPLTLTGRRAQEVLPLVAANPVALTNRQEGRMTTVAMTGVTALVRAAAKVMEAYGVTYPAKDIKDWLLDADLTHISNEVCFDTNYQPQTDPESLRFSSKDSYIELLEAVSTDIVELTGNHMLDYGPEPFLHTLDLYRQRGWQWFGAGEDLEAASRPLKVEHNGNRLAFLGCNWWGPPSTWATEDSPGCAPCDFARMQAQVRALRSEGYLPVVTFQYMETYEYTPTPQQVVDFRSMAEAGAVVVQGSQAHQPQAIEFQDEAFIHYGLGNLFFDQMQTLGTRQEFIDRLVFYDNRLLSVELRTAMLEEWARPRPMTPEERAALLREIFAIQP